LELPMEGFSASNCDVIATKALEDGNGADGKSPMRKQVAAGAGHSKCMPATNF
jgi:hypothetical protein